MNQIIQYDHYLFELFNSQLSNGLFDTLMPVFTQAVFWLPMYLFIFTFFIFNYPGQSWKFIAVTLLSILLADQLSSSFIKPLVDRCRPCQLEGFADQVRLLVKCGSGKSFVSGHATNHFALATCWMILMGSRFRWIIPALFLWASTIAFSRVYVGVHFPLDIFFGGLLGILIGLFTGSLGKKWANF